MSSELNLPSAAMRESTMRSLRTAARRCHQMGLSWGQERDGARSPPQTYQITPRARERGRGGAEVNGVNIRDLVKRWPASWSPS